MSTHQFRQTVTIPEAARLLGVGRNTLYDAVARGEIPVLRIGRRILIAQSAFARFLAGTTEGQE